MRAPGVGCCQPCRALPMASNLCCRSRTAAGRTAAPHKRSGDETTLKFEPSNHCKKFVGRNGEEIDVMDVDYGFRTGAGRMYQDKFGEIPESGWALALNNFKLEYESLRRSFRFDEYDDISDRNPPTGFISKFFATIGAAFVRLMAQADKALEKTPILPKLFPIATAGGGVIADPDTMIERTTKFQVELRRQLRKLKLSNEAVWERERARDREGLAVDTPLYMKTIYYGLCIFLDKVFENRPIQRFWFLEVVARMPYFSYISMLHLYESLGWWRASAELRKVHFAEEWNELHHLQIMETLGGDALWVDRFVAQHAAILYYWILVLTFLVSPRLAYNFSELIEAHAVDTYGEFVDANEELLKSLPPPLVAAQYYKSDDLYMFDEFQTSIVRSPRRPECRTLYDVFVNIRDDENEHVKTMKGCQTAKIVEDLDERKELLRQP